MNQYIIIMLQTTLGVGVVIALVRIAGLRSFSKMSSFDFALTLAIGSLLASAMSASNAPWPQILALTMVFVLRMLIAMGRQRFKFIETLTDNTPLLLMHNGEFLHENLQASHVTTEELVAKLREANVTRISDVRAVVLETTGSISVLQGDHLDEALLRNVRGTPNAEVPMDKVGKPQA